MEHLNNAQTMVLQDIITVFLSIFIEALPFIVFGVLISSLLHIFVKSEQILATLPKNKFLQNIIMSFLGVFFPVCECGNIPVARKLIQKNLPPSAAISFLLAAPVLNPIVIIATIIAFPDNPEIIWGRIGLSFMIAIIVGFIFSFATKDEILIKSIQVNKTCDHHHRGKKLHAFSEHFIGELSTMAGILVFGAGIAAASQNLIPKEFMVSVAENPFLAICSMMLLAFIISICSTTDAFFALAYAHQFTSPALLAFLVFGPMIDIKSLLLMQRIFKIKALIYLVLLVFGLVLFSTLLMTHLTL
ncbi:permease [Candidatus Peregrinibacteria bacterium]|nr:permease [Candidatus Peregrinibacteria bacterium]